MFCREDIELIVDAMYKDELRDIAQKINNIETSINEVIKLNSGYKKYLRKFFLIWDKIYYFFRSDIISDSKILSKVLVSHCQKEIEYKLELQRLQMQKKEIKNLYDYIVNNIVENDLVYAQNLILMRSIGINHDNQSHG